MSSDREKRSVSDVARVRDLVRSVATGGDQADAVNELFGRSFVALERCVAFDIGVIALIEHHLELYVSGRPAATRSLVDDLATRIREALSVHVSPSLSSAEIVVAAERHDLPDGDVEDLQHSAVALVYQDRRVAGLLMLFRGGEPFSESEEQIVEVFAVQLSLLLAIGRARAQIVDLAETDELTGIGNKRRLRRGLAHEIERARAFNQPLSLLLFDIDDFKAINDGFGHVAGDAVLSELCAAVKSTLRDIDSMARFGGDEFAIILPNTDPEGARAVADRALAIVRSLSIPADDNATIVCSVSIGLATLGSSDVTSTDLLRRADEHMYVSKRSGKNRYTA